MKFVSWNVNGLRACLNKGFMDFFHMVDADIFCVQETKMQVGQAEINTPLHKQYFHSAVRKGYSGTAVFTKKEPLQVIYGIEANHMEEGRVITLEFEDFYLVNVYTPNAQPELKRIDYRMEFENDLRQYLSNLKKIRPVILCGDLNVAHHEIDLKNAKANVGSPGFSNEERGKFTELLEEGFIDSFRYLYPETIKYSWWSYRMAARSRNVGWRIDYFVLSENLKSQLKDAVIYNEILGSDHCPVGLTLQF